MVLVRCSGSVRRQWRGHRSGVTHVAAQPSSRYVLTCGAAGDLKLWDPEHGTQASLRVGGLVLQAWA